MAEERKLCLLIPFICTTATAYKQNLYHHASAQYMCFSFLMSWLQASENELLNLLENWADMVQIELLSEPTSGWASFKPAAKAQFLSSLEIWTHFCQPTICALGHDLEGVSCVCGLLHRAFVFYDWEDLLEQSLSLSLVFKVFLKLLCRSVGFMIHSIRLLAWCYNYTH